MAPGGLGRPPRPPTQRLLLALCTFAVVFLSAAASGAAEQPEFLDLLRRARRLAQASSTPYARLRLGVYTPTLYRDDRTCRAVGDMVARGGPSGCGTGCQWVSNVTGFSTAFINSGVSSSLSIVGAPDVYPSYGDNTKAWSPAIPNFGDEYLQFTVATSVFVTGIHVYETHHPGAIIKIEGRASGSGSTPGSWITLWSGSPSPIPLPFDPFASSERVSAARIFKPAISAPRETLLNEFRLKLNTDKTVVGIGYTELDAVKVLGDSAVGQPLSTYTPVCASVADSDCYYTCTASDVLADADAANTLTLVNRAISWIALALRIVRPSSPAVTLPYTAATDTATQYCGDVLLPTELMAGNAGLFGANVVLLVTGRPSATGKPAITTCKFDSSTGRPIGLWLNVPPGMATAALAASSGQAGTIGQEPAQGAVDTLIHYLFRGLGWDKAFQTKFPTSLGVSVVKTTSNATAASATSFATRPLTAAFTAKAIAAVEAHFGGAVGYMEMESQGGSDVAGVLLASRVYRGELMAAPGPTGRPLAKSNLSLAYLEDSGWYVANYSATVPLPWGRGLGNAFATKACSNWPSLGASHYVCPQSTAGTFDTTTNLTSSCTADRVAKGVCLLTQYTSALPSIYQYFGGPPNTAYGGISTYYDYCPLVDTLTASSTGDCRLVANTPSPNAVGEELGPASRCFSYTKQAATKPGCFKHACVNGALYVKLASAWQLCPSSGSITSADLTFTVTCPRTAELCDVFPTAVPPTITIYSITSAFSVIQSGGVYPPTIDIALELANFVVPTQGKLQVLVGSATYGNVVHANYSLPAGGAILNTTLRVVQLPPGALTLTVALVDGRGVIKTSVAQALTVSLEFAQWVTSVRNVSSQYVSAVPLAPTSANRQASKLIGANDCLTIIADATTRSAYGSCASAWAPSSGGTGNETIDVAVATSVYLTYLEPFEVFSPGAFSKAWAIDTPNGAVDEIWDGPRPTLTIPSSGAAIDTTKQAVRAAAYKTSAVRLQFTTPPWVEVDAVRVWGYVETPAKLYPAWTGALTYGLLAGAKQTVTITVKNNGTSTLHWALSSPTTATAAWVTPLTTSGVSASKGDIVISLLLDASVSSVGAYQSVTFAIVDKYAATATATLLSRTLALEVSFVPPAVLPRTLCYHGIVVGASTTSAGVCQCDPGAYGQACEFLSCPGNCSSSVSVQRGVCNHASGRCACIPGFTGADCSGQDGDCYVSYDGSCRSGWSRGSYVLNAEDSNNVNKGTGSLPRQLQCAAAGGLSAASMTRNVNTYGCSIYPTFEFCCRPVQAAACPFASPAPCSAAGCVAISDWAALLAGSSTDAPAVVSTCLTSLTTYCFNNAYDPVCSSGLLEAGVPPDYCPTALVLSYCAANPTDADCVARVVAARPACLFASVSGTPCADPSCLGSQGTFDPACQTVIDSYCVKNQADRECELHGRGDGCLFLADSAPCSAPECIWGTTSYDSALCAAAAVSYCKDATGAGPTDPECVYRGLGASLATVDLPVNAGNSSAQCAWSIVVKQCTATPTAPECLRLRAARLITSSQTAAGYAWGSALAVPLADYSTAASANFTASAAALDAARQTAVLRKSLYLVLFAFADKNGDLQLNSGEIPAVAQYLEGVGAGAIGGGAYQGAGGALVSGCTPTSCSATVALLAEVASTGGEVGYTRFGELLDALG